MEARLECVVSGRVQMVMFRDFTAHLGRRLGIVGFVQNKSDGTVRVVAEGSKQTLEIFLEKLSEGPKLARVDLIEKTWSDPTEEFTTFSIKYKNIWDRI